MYNDSVTDNSCFCMQEQYDKCSPSVLLKHLQYSHSSATFSTDKNDIIGFHVSTCTFQIAPQFGEFMVIVE